MSEKKSTTEEETFVGEALIGSSHYKTAISDGEKTVEGRGMTPEEAQEIASEKWDEEEDED